MQNKLIAEEELLLLQSKLRGQIAHNSQTANQRAERIAQLRGLNLPIDYDKLMLKEISLITSNQLRDIARSHLQKPLISLCGPSTSIEKIEKKWEYYKSNKI